MPSPLRFLPTVVYPLLIGVSGLLVPVACVDQLDLSPRQSVNVVVVDGTITNLVEPQIIRLTRSRSDSLTGRFGHVPLTNARVAVVVDSARVLACHETTDGAYQLPSDFRGQVGHAYQLRFTLSDGTRYESTQQIMQAGPAIEGLSVRFSATSLPAGLYPAGFRAGYDAFLTTRDPANQHNYYRWDWNLYEKQTWCHTCYQSMYIDTVQQGYVQNGVYVTTRQPVEACVDTPVRPNADYWFSNTCRTQCWDILHNYTLNLFDDRLTNGATLTGRPVAQVPLFTRQPALLELRQSALTPDAYRYFQLFQQQTQHTGGVADTPPSILTGNVINTGNGRQPVVGYFTASSVSVSRYWLDKNDATAFALGSYDDSGTIVQRTDELYFAQYGRVPVPGPDGPPFVPGGPGRYITAPCLPSNNRTPVTPVGWRD